MTTRHLALKKKYIADEEGLKRRLIKTTSRENVLLSRTLRSNLKQPGIGSYSKGLRLARTRSQATDRASHPHTPCFLSVVSLTY